MILGETFRLVQQFGPLRRLNAPHPFQPFGRKKIRRLEIVHPPHVDPTGPGMAAVPRMLLHVNVAIGSGHHHDRLSGRGGLPTYVDVLPTVNQRRRTQIAGLNGLVPGRACLADAMDEVFEAVYEISPQLGGRFHLFLRHQRPAAGTIPPIADADLVAADMDVFRRKKSGELLQNVAQHFEILFATGAKRFPHLLRLVGNRTGRPAERFRINRRKRLAVSGQVDLRDDLHVAERGVIHDLADILLRIESAVTLVPRAVGRR